MAGSGTLVLVALQIFVACLALSAQEGNTPCFDASGTCTANADAISVLSEDSSIEHLSYVQIKAAKVGQNPESENPIEKALEKASQDEGDTHPDDDSNGYVPPPESDMGGSWKEIQEQYANERHPVLRTYAPNLWAYESKADGAKGPSHWGEVPDSSCGAGLQSPIDIKTDSEATKIHPTASVKDLELIKETTECDSETGYLLTASNAIRLYEGNCSITFKAIWREKVFHMISIHYSSPSEHTIDGAYFPMEVHHVHKSADDEQKLIIAVGIAALTAEEAFSSQDKTAASFLEASLQHMPRPKPDQNHKNRFERHFDSEMWDPYEEFLKGHLGNGFWHYSGSTTTPPCQMETLWMIDPVPINVPFSTIRNYRKLINSVPENKLALWGDIVGTDSDAEPPWADGAGMVFENAGLWNSKLKCNNRPTQPLDGRTVWGINVSLPVLTTAEPMPGDAELAGDKK